MIKKIALIFLTGINSLLTAQNIDTTFGTNGIVITNLGFYEVIAKDQVIQPDGKILIVGFATINSTSSEQGIVIRFNPNGELDTTFNAIGYKLLDNFSASNLQCSIKLVADGKILVGGRHTSFQKLNSDGSYDISFGQNGIVNQQVSYMCIQPDGKILVSYGAGTACGLARFTSNGILDVSFGVSGNLLFSGGGQNFGGQINLFSNGQIGFHYFFSSSPGSFNGHKIIKLNADGSSTGLEISDSGYNASYQAYHFIIASDNEVIVNSVANNIFRTKRYNSNFQIDSSFGNNGSSTIFPRADLMLLQTDGKILVLNNNTTLQNDVASTTISLYRSTVNCTMLDSSFANGGIMDLSSILLGYEKFARNSSVFNQSIILSGQTPLLNTPWYSKSVFLTKINLEGSLNTDEISNPETITISPNPASDYVNIKTLEDDTDVKVYNSIGMLVKEIKVKKESNVNIEELETGLYFFKINSKIFKLIKK